MGAERTENTEHERGDMMETETKQSRTRHSGRIRKRSVCPGDDLRTHRVTVRMTRSASAELASIQGLCWRFGKRETVAALFETVALPAIRAHVRPYADRAKAERLAEREAV